MAVANGFVTALLLLAAAVVTHHSSASVVEHFFYVQNLTVKPLCKEIVIPTVNGSLPGPTVNVREGDTLVVHVFNKLPYNITIHWHGVFQRMSAWMDGTDMVTQCPIKHGDSFMYRFNITGQEGTLQWHAHNINLRAFVHGALVIRPRVGRSYPFPKPYKEILIILEQWWDRELRYQKKGPTPLSDAFLINGFAGNSYVCSQNKMFKVEVTQGKRYLLRIINAALNPHLFFKIANHNLTVVALDAAYTIPYVTEVVVLAPGQTVDAILDTNQPVGSYYMASHPYNTAIGIAFTSNLTTALLVYRAATSSSTPSAVLLPDMTDTATAHKFFSNITGLVGGPHWTPVPVHVDVKMFITTGLGLKPCPLGQKCPGPYGKLFGGSLNNRSFVYPETLPLQAAYFYNVFGVYTDDFPDQPPTKFDYTNIKTRSSYSMLFPERKTSVKILEFNSTVEIVLQNTALITTENHPMHLHGFNFHVLAQGFGNYDPNQTATKLNLVNPQIRNTIAVPTGGWAVLRFVANNPGAWMFHCHMDAHLAFGIITVFIVQNGPTPATSLPSPPPDLPLCSLEPPVNYENPTTDRYY